MTSSEPTGGRPRINGTASAGVRGLPISPAAGGERGVSAASRYVGSGWETVAQLRGQVAARLEAERARLGRLSDADERALGRGLVAAEIEAWTLARANTGEPALGPDAERALAAAVTAALFGFGRLQPLLDRDDIENIHIHGADRVVLDLADGRREIGPPIAESDAELMELLTGWAARAGQTGREFSPAHPILNLRLPAGGPLGARLAAVMEVTARPTVAIRRHRLTHVTLADLTRLGTTSRLLEAFLAAAVRTGCNIVVSGAPSVGKTTLLRALAAEIPAHEHVVTVEEEYELGLHLIGSAGAGQRLVTAMETRQANAEGVGEIGLHTLLTQALRHSPSRVIVGEVRGGEVTALLAALSNGAAGGMCTLHATSATGVLSRIAQLGQLSDPPLAPEAAWRFTAEAVDLVVHLNRDGTGRFVSEVVEVGSVGDGARPDTTTVFAPGPDGRAVPAYTPSGRLQQRLVAAGFALGWHPDPASETGTGGGAR